MSDDCLNIITIRSFSQNLAPTYSWSFFFFLTTSKHSQRSRLINVIRLKVKKLTRLLFAFVGDLLISWRLDQAEGIWDVATPAVAVFSVITNALSGFSRCQAGAISRLRPCYHPVGLDSLLSICLFYTIEIARRLSKLGLALAKLNKFDINQPVLRVMSVVLLPSALVSATRGIQLASEK